MKTCNVEGCTDRHRCKGYCAKHYRAFRAHGDPLVQKVGGKPREYCSLDDCNLPRTGRGFCDKHYRRFKKHNDAQAVGVTRPCDLCGKPVLGVARRKYCDECMPESLSRHAAIRAERLKNNNEGMTSEDWSQTKAYKSLIINDPCVYCGGVAQAIDHITPVKSGGSDRWENLAPICKPCNSSKNAKGVLQYMLAS